jgi:hypothetical protein
MATKKEILDRIKLKIGNKHLPSSMFEVVDSLVLFYNECNELKQVYEESNKILNNFKNLNSLSLLDSPKDPNNLSLFDNSKDSKGPGDLNELDSIIGTNDTCTWILYLLRYLSTVFLTNSVKYENFLLNTILLLSSYATGNIVSTKLYLCKIFNFKLFFGALFSKHIALNILEKVDNMNKDHHIKTFNQKIKDSTEQVIKRRTQLSQYLNLAKDTNVNKNNYDNTKELLYERLQLDLILNNGKNTQNKDTSLFNNLVEYKLLTTKEDKDMIIVEYEYLDDIEIVE